MGCEALYEDLEALGPRKASLVRELLGVDSFNQREFWIALPCLLLQATMLSRPCRPANSKAADAPAGARVACSSCSNPQTAVQLLMAVIHQSRLC